RRDKNLCRPYGAWVMFLCYPGLPAWATLFRTFGARDLPVFSLCGRFSSADECSSFCYLFTNLIVLTIPFPSSTVIVWPAAMLVSLSVLPLGHSICTDATLVFCPRPNVRTSSLWER